VAVLAGGGERSFSIGGRIASHRAASAFFRRCAASGIRGGVCALALFRRAAASRIFVKFEILANVAPSEIIASRTQFV
jgi:hypothetical protein